MPLRRLSCPLPSLRSTRYVGVPSLTTKSQPLQATRCSSQPTASSSHFTSRQLISRHPAATEVRTCSEMTVETAFSLSDVTWGSAGRGNEPDSTHRKHTALRVTPRNKKTQLHPISYMSKTLDLKGQNTHREKTTKTTRTSPAKHTWHDIKEQKTSETTNNTLLYTEGRKPPHRREKPTARVAELNSSTIHHNNDGSSKLAPQ